MTSGAVPFNAPTVAGILMKQITEPAPLLHESGSSVPEDLSLAIARCLEKDPESRWPTADSLRRALESRTVTGYRPTGSSRARPRTSEVGSRRSATGRPPLSPRGRPVPAMSRPPAALDKKGAGEWRKNERGEWVRTEPGELPIPDTGEPAIVQKVRGQFARWAATTLGLFLLNIATGLDTPWFLFPAGGMAIGMLRNYSKLWQAGYSWRDVLNPPRAADAIAVPGAKGRKMIGTPRAEEFGPFYDRIEATYRDRKMILSLMQQLPAADRQMLPPEIVETTEDLYQRACELARALHELDSTFGQETPERIKQRLDLLSLQPEGHERERQIGILERQLKTATELMDRRNRIAARLESSLLAMQNLRFDMLRLKSAGVSAVLSDLTSATQQARAISRDVDHALSAAAEVKEAIG
jgi:serine/threonine-protein kinase